MQFLFNLAVMQFETWGVSFQLREDSGTGYRYFSGTIGYPYGDRRQRIELVNVEHDYEFHPDSRRMESGRVTLVATDGRRFEVTMRALSVVYLKCGGYFGFRGFTHGLWLGPDFIDGLELDISHPDTVNEASFLDDVMCEFRCGDDIGYGIVELVIPGSYPRYGF